MYTIYSIMLTLNLSWGIHNECVYLEIKYAIIVDFNEELDVI